MISRGWFNKTAPAVLAVFLVGFIPATGYTFFWFYKNFSRTAHFIVDTAREASLAGLSGAEHQEPVTLLIFGIDAGEWVGGTVRDETGRADTIVLLRADPVAKTASLFSIPRDTLVEIPGRPGDDKINHAYAFGRAALLAETVERFTGVGIDYYVGLNYLAFKDIVDLLGGVEFEVDRVIQSRGLRLEPGLQVLDGDAAFAVISTRQDPLGDIDRVRRQQRFIKAVASEARARPPDDLFFMMLAAWKHLDTNVTLPEAVHLARALRGIEDEDMVTAVVPGWFYNRGGISYWRAYPEETAQVIADLFGETEGQP
ncbi:MAG: LCP family protein [Bacillota bacterium]